MPKVRHCVIKSCEYFDGTVDPSIHMFRNPSDEQIKLKWINVIRQVNNDNYSGSGFVCQLHFAPELMNSNKRNEKTLRKGSVPSEFLVELLEQPDDGNEHGTHCDNCEQLRMKINELEKIIIKQNLYNDVKKQKAEKTIAELKETIKNNRLEIKKQKIEIIALEEKFKCYEGKRCFLDCLLNGIETTKKYPEEVRQFALTLSFLSPRAYEFVRKFFDDHLPSKSTIRAWYANSDLHSRPGINSTSLKIISSFVDEKKNEGKELVACLCFDEMSIRQHLQWCHSSKIMLGIATINNENESDDNLAKQVIVYMLSGLNMRFKIPVAYHFISSLNGKQRMELLQEVIGELENINVRIANVAFDGFSANATMAALLGANLDVNSNDFNPSFYSRGGQRICIMYDNCHIKKLVRNHLGKKKTFFINDEKIEWKFFEKLVQVEGCSLSHKMTKKHIDFSKNPMKVDLAVQTLSLSTASSMENLMHAGFSEFKDASETIDFTRMFNNLFDVFNTKSDKNDTIYRSALNLSNCQEIFCFFEKAVQYIKSLMVIEDSKKIAVVNSQAKVGFRGFIINMQSLQLIYNEYVVQRKILDSIQTYWLGQDMLEIFFGKLRSHGGYNDNPTPQQFTAAFRKLLANDSLLASKDSNCKEFTTDANPFFDIFYVSSRSTINYVAEGNVVDDESIFTSQLHELFSKLNNIEMVDENSTEKDILVNSSIAQIAKFIETKIELSDRQYCLQCKNVFKREDKCEFSFVSPERCKPCKSTFEICRITNIFILLQILKENIDFNIINHAIWANINIENLYKNTDFSHEPEHKIYLIRSIIDVYIQVKANNLAKMATLDLQSKINIRPKLHKLIHFYGV